MEESKGVHYVITVDQQSPVATKPPFPPAGFFMQEHNERQSISGPSFLRKQRENAAPYFPVSITAWLLLREVCDWYDSDFTEDGGETGSPKHAISIRLLLLFVPIMAVVDLIINFAFCVFVVPLVFLWCCYPFKTKLVEARQKGPPVSCCLLHEACDPILRVVTSIFLLFGTPIVLCGICFPTSVMRRLVYWADGHTGGYIYCDRSCLWCQSQYTFGLFFRNRSVGDVMA